MKKYLVIAYLSLLQMFTYRLSFILWRFRNIFNLVFIYYLWTSIFTNKNSLFSYSQEKLMTYILVMTLVSSLVLSTRTAEICADIISGNLINYLLKPISFFKLVLSKEFTDKLLNFTFSVIEIFLLVIILKPHFFIQANSQVYFFAFLSFLIGSFIAFLISLNISLIAFWSSEIWAPRWIYSILIWFLAGSFFPLDILPDLLYKILLLTPFPYLFFIPTKIYLDGFSLNIFPPIVISLVWCYILFIVTKKVWKNGIKNYNAYGR